jgi:hypothetical protein
MDPVAHASVALITKPLAPEAPLWALIAATQLPDLLFFAFEAAGLEEQAETEMDFRQGLTYHSEPTIYLSHGLLVTLLWSTAVGAIAGLVKRDRRAGAAVGLMVLSHWLLDFTAYPNMPLLLDKEPKAGLGLVTSGRGVIAGIILEIGLIAGGLRIYLRQRKESRISTATGT